MAKKMQTYDETRLLKRSPLSTTGTPRLLLRSPNVERKIEFFSFKQLLLFL